MPSCEKSTDSLELEVHSGFGLPGIVDDVNLKISMEEFGTGPKRTISNRRVVATRQGSEDFVKFSR